MRRWIALVLGLVLLVPTGGPAVASPRGPAVVGMGDSLVSGEGTGEYLPATNHLGNFCHRSDRAAIGQVVLPGVRNPTRVNLACAGATTNNVRLGGTPRYGEAPQAEQLRAVARRYQVKVVVLTVGVNDVGYANLVYDCVLAYFRLAHPCSQAWTPRIQDRLTAAAPRIARDVADIRQVLTEAGYHSGDYSIVLQSYPSPTTGDQRYRSSVRGLYGCPVRTDDGEWARDWVAPEFTAVLARVASAQHVRFLDLAPALRGREACAKGITRAQEWSRGVYLSLAALRHGMGPNLIQESAHPNVLGQAQFARCLNAFLAQRETSAKCARQASGDLAPVRVASLPPFPLSRV